MARVLAQAAQIEELTGRIAELEAKLGGPPKTPDNSSVPPPQGSKSSQAARRAANKRKGRPGVFRALSPDPDRIVASVAERCPHCEHALIPADQLSFHAYDHLELPPIPHSSSSRGVPELPPRLQRAAARRDARTDQMRGLKPHGLAFWPQPGGADSPLHVTQAIGFERLVHLLDEVFRIRVSEGAIANILARAGTPLTAAAETTTAEVRSSKGGGLGRDLGPGRGKKLVAMGAALLHRCPPYDCR